MIEKKIIYLDYNVFASHFNNDVAGLREVVDALKEKYMFPYSPAHLEDLGSSIMWRKFEEEEIKDVAHRCGERLQSISDISNNYEIFPGQGNNPTRIIQEHPGQCLMRVLEYFDRNRFLDSRERKLLKDLKASDVDGARSRIASNLPVTFLSSAEYDSEIKKKFNSDAVLQENARQAGLPDFSWESISISHQVLEHVFEILMNYLEELRFKPEKVKMARSRMHDVTHAIYATKANFFVTGDDRFCHKVRVAYTYLGVPTKIMHLDEFLKTGHQL